MSPDVEHTVAENLASQIKAGLRTFANNRIVTRIAVSECKGMRQVKSRYLYVKPNERGPEAHFFCHGKAAWGLLETTLYAPEAEISWQHAHGTWYYIDELATKYDLSSLLAEQIIGFNPRPQHERPGAGSEQDQIRSQMEIAASSGEQKTLDEYMRDWDNLIRNHVSESQDA